jgi:predicted metalloprotease with PDZ domain
VSAEVSGLDLDDFFDASVRGTGELPLEQLLKSHGVDYHVRQSMSGSDKGGKAAGVPDTPAILLGVSLSESAGKTTVTSVANGGPAELAGIAPGDEVVALDGLKLTRGNCDRRLKRYRNKDKLELVVFRDESLLTTKIKLAEAPQDTCYLAPSPDADAEVVERRDAWLGV